MAITDSLPGFDVRVVVNGAALQEYEDDEVPDDHHSTMRFIESATGETFKIDYTLHPQTKFLGDMLKLNVCIDGKRVTKAVIRQERVGQSGHTGSIKGVYCSEYDRREFRFASLRTDENTDTTAMDAKKIKKLGTIRIEAYYARRLRRQDRTSFQDPTKLEPLNTIPEKSLKGKAISHSVSFQSVVPDRLSVHHSWKTELVDPLKGPIAVYTFRYRSKEALKSMFILPHSQRSTPNRSQSPPPLTKRDPNSLSQAEIAEMQRRLNELEDHAAARINIKREEHENSPPRRKVRKSDKITVIELDDEGEIISEKSMKRNDTTDSTRLVNIE